MRHLVIFCLLLVLIILLTLKGYRKVQRQNRKIDFLKETFSIVVLLSAIYLIDSEAYTKLELYNTSKGITFGVDFISLISPIFFIPFLLQIFEPKKWQAQTTDGDKSIFGYPKFLLPSTTNGFFTFTIYVFAGVIFEELICRQFLFYYLYHLLSIKGDYIVIISSALFAVPHFYQGYKGVISNFILGLIIGKIFLVSGSIFLCIILHLMLNSTLLVIAWKRIRLKKFSIEISEKFQ